MKYTKVLKLHSQEKRKSKGGGEKWKLRLIEDGNPEWKDLYEGIIG